MVVPLNTMFFLSPSNASALTGFRDFSTGTDSPVRIASCSWSSVSSRILASAGIFSPASRRMTSPGTSCVASIFFSFPSLKTIACRLTIFLSASMAFCAWYSCTKPITAFAIRITPITMASRYSPIAPEMTTAATRIQTIGFSN